MVRKIAKLPYKLFRFLFKKSALDSYVSAGKGLEERSTPLECRLHHRRIARQKKRQAARYDSFAKMPDLDKPYLFFPLHAQPERTTNPIGGRFADLPLMVPILLKAIPKHWSIYIKEHKIQFDPNLSRILPRKDNFYERLNISKRITFIPADADPFQLIDRARAVATVSGDPGWEAVNRDTPALVFGAAWYLGCEGVFPVKNVAQCTAAIDQITSGYRIDGQKVRLFWEAARQSCIEAAIHENFARAFDIPDEQTTANISGVIEEWLSQNIPTKKDSIL